MVVANAYTLMPPRASYESVESHEPAAPMLRSPFGPTSNDIDTVSSTPPTSGVKVENIPATAETYQDVPHTARPHRVVSCTARPQQGVPHTARAHHNIPPSPLPIHLNHPKATTYDTGILALSRLLHLRHNPTTRFLENNNNLILKQIQILKHLLLMDLRESSLTRYVERLAECQMLLQNQNQNQWNAMNDNDTQERQGDFLIFNLNACKEIEDVMERILQYLDGTHFHLRIGGVRKDMDPLTAVEGLLRIIEKICDSRVLEKRVKGLIEVKFREMAFLQHFQLSAIQDHYRAHLDALGLQQPMRYGFTNIAVNRAWMNAQRTGANIRQAASNPIQQIPNFDCAGPNCRACRYTSSSAPIPRTPLRTPFQAARRARQFGYPNPSSEPRSPTTSPYSTQSSYHSSDPNSNLSQQPTPKTPPFPPSPPPPSSNRKLAPFSPSEPWNTSPTAPPSNHFNSREPLNESKRQIPDDPPRANQKKRRHRAESDVDSRAFRAKVQRVWKT